MSQLSELLDVRTCCEHGAAPAHAAHPGEMSCRGGSLLGDEGAARRHVPEPVVDGSCVQAPFEASARHDDRTVGPRSSGWRGVSLAGAVTSRRRQPGQLLATAAVSGGSSSTRCGSPRGSTVERLGVRARPCGVTDGGWLRSPRARSCCEHARVRIAVDGAGGSARRDRAAQCPQRRPPSGDGRPTSVDRGHVGACAACGPRRCRRGNVGEC
jgi:hypothetical protein